VSDVERRVDSALPPGSTREEIEAWLTAQEIEHGFSDVPSLRTTTAGCGLQEVRGAGGAIAGIIRDTDRSLLVRAVFNCSSFSAKTVG
jgi:hypothetical protein